MKIVGITTIRNEEGIIKDTLDHFTKFCNAGIYVYDDASEDRTVDICKKHFAIETLIKGKNWSKERMWAQAYNRQRVLKEAQKDNPDWLIYFDADERIDWDFKGFENYDAIKMKLFDFYITEEDKDKNYKERKWIGPEFRRIIMMFKNSPYLKYYKKGQREVSLSPNAKILEAGFVKHYGKAISVKEWDKTCDYYSRYFPEQYSEKWLERKGKSIHTKSDLGNRLITWDGKEKSHIFLTIRDRIILEKK